MRTHRWTAIACVYFVMVVVVDIAAGSHQNFTGLFAVVPVLLALEWGPGVVLVGSIPLVLLSGTELLFFDSEPTDAIIVRTIGVAVGAGVGIYLASYRVGRESQLVHSQAAAQAAQEAILPIVPPSIGPLRFACAYRAAADESHIGGDFYKVIETDAGVRLILGDVRGKGLDAIAMTAAVLGCFREWAPEVATLKSLVGRLETRVVDKSQPGDFVTCVLACVDGEMNIEVLNCGHPSPVVLMAGGGYPISPARRSRPLGMSPDPEVVSVSLAPGDRVLFYTDGLIECRDGDGAWIELDASLLAPVGTDSFYEALPRLLERLQKRARVIDDDIALLLVEAGDNPPGEV